ncbi:hypothetical protein NBG4_10079 [Candidatus Sulfobium mesophilum]|uniref:Uncharacterized protein n=1 Tax=Candidatus Sulfobium mesophilum TaxID=2016548 RepID=A0A2U3QDY0_9BACT|nr:hypothetical protein NBG4_10079 [Candidatus Sulfobium mesophilum]
MSNIECTANGTEGCVYECTPVATVTFFGDRFGELNKTLRRVTAVSWRPMENFDRKKAWVTNAGGKEASAC